MYTGDMWGAKNVRINFTELANALSATQLYELIQAIKMRKIKEGERIRLKYDGTYEVMVASDFFNKPMEYPDIDGNFYTGNADLFSQVKHTVESKFWETYCNYQGLGADLEFKGYNLFFTDRHSSFGQIFTGRPADKRSKPINNPKGDYVAFYGVGCVGFKNMEMKVNSDCMSFGLAEYRPSEAANIARRICNDEYLLKQVVAAFGSRLERIAELER